MENEKIDIEIPKEIKTINNFLGWAFTKTKKDSIHLLESGELLYQWYRETFNPIEKLIENSKISLDNVKQTDLKRFVSTKERQPKKEGSYFILRENSNPNLITSCSPGIHYFDGKEWSSETGYWLEDVKYLD